MRKQTRFHRSLIAAGIAAALCGLPLTVVVAQTQGAAQDVPVGQRLDNAAITATIKTKLMADGRTKAFDINVDTDGTGKVTLRGTAPTAASKAAAEEIARGVKGVTAVDNALIVAPRGSVAAKSAEPATASQKLEAHGKHAGKAVSDGWITTKVKSEFLASREVKGLDINVSTRGGVVTLAGTVPTEAMRSRAIEIASVVDGVKRVDAQALMVDATAQK